SARALPPAARARGGFPSAVTTSATGPGLRSTSTPTSARHGPRGDSRQTGTGLPSQVAVIASAADAGAEISTSDTPPCSGLFHFRLTPRPPVHSAEEAGGTGSSERMSASGITGLPPGESKRTPAGRALTPLVPPIRLSHATQPGGRTMTWRVLLLLFSTALAASVV